MFTYTSDLIYPTRRKTTEITVGDVRVGGFNPVVVQSMTTTPTTDTIKTVDQIQKLIEVGCPIVRVTTPTMADVDNLPNIKSEMKKRNLHVPLVADVHFLPNIALKACDHVEKVRINPGNFADRKRFEIKEYTDQDYALELERIRETFLPIVKRAKLNGVALRIGTNHGSLSDRIMNRFGDSPKGMVESALEFILIAQDEGFKNMVVSMKASNVQVMIQAYRLLVSRMNELSMQYPLHLGVTEAGDGEDGRIKSAIGIGSLLRDGLGDTIRVSLTEDPEFEIPVAKKILELYEIKQFDSKPTERLIPSWDFYAYQRRQTQKIESKGVCIGEKEPQRVSVKTSLRMLDEILFEDRNNDPLIERISVEVGANEKDISVLKTQKRLPILLRLKSGQMGDVSNAQFDEISLEPNLTWLEPSYKEKFLNFLKNKMLWINIKNEKNIAPALQMLQAFQNQTKMGVEIEGTHLIGLGRKVRSALDQREQNVPVYLIYKNTLDMDLEKKIMHGAVEIGSLLTDGFGDGVEVQGMDWKDEKRLCFNVLQATRQRMSKTEFIACPSCGRTLFDLQETTQRIRAQTGHLKGLKIAIMGCIVNGPGEMADADFGYVGSGPGRINLYVGQDCVERHIPQADADQRLIELIKSHNRWIDPT